MKISIVIGTFNQKDILKKTLKSLIKQDFPKDQYEIIVVDSMSSDGTENMVKEFDIRYIRRKNQGKSIARNKGILEASGEIILLTDADMVATPNLVAEHVKAHANKKNAIFEGLTINPDGKPYIKEKIKPLQKMRWSYFLTGNLSIKGWSF